LLQPLPFCNDGILDGFDLGGGGLLWLDIDDVATPGRGLGFEL
jgi:hypothetical protein